MDIEEDPHYKKLRAEAWELSEKKNIIMEKVKNKEQEISEYYISKRKERSLQFVGKAFKDVRDTSFLKVLRWDDDECSLMMVEYLDRESSKPRLFKVYEYYCDEEDFTVKDTHFEEITTEDFEKRRVAFMKKYNL